MSKLHRIGLMAAVFVVFTSALHAGIISEETAYWYLGEQGLATKFNPDADWLVQKAAEGALRIRVHQTVYDLAESSAMLLRNGDGPSWTGYLYVYAVSNLNTGDIADLSDWGITNFSANWSVAPIYVTTSRQTLPDWIVDQSANAPAWKWQNMQLPGILPGETVGGLWALTNVATSADTDASAVHKVVTDEETLTGTVRGPYIVPDAPSVLALTSGFIGLGVTRRFRRR